MRSAAASEQGFIRLIERVVRSRGYLKVGIGDDACVLRNGTVLSADSYVEGVHFDLSYMTLRQAGFRCACAALSDVVAMGAGPEVLLVALALPEAAGRREVSSLYRGIEEACAALGCEVAGGDIIAADRLFISLTSAGRTRRPLLRSAARAGDTLYVTGYLGSAEAGRACLRQGNRQRRFAELVKRHLRPLPRLAAMRLLRRRIRALIDTSDGIASDARRLAEQSGVKVVLEPDGFPVARGTKELCARLGLAPTGFALCSGEDFELLFSSRQPIPRVAAGVPVSRVGRVEKGKGLFAEEAGSVVPVTVSGYDHIADRLGKRRS